VVRLRSTASEASARIMMLKLRDRIAERRASGDESRLRITVNAIRCPHACEQAVRALRSVVFHAAQYATTAASGVTRSSTVLLPESPPQYLRAR